MATERYDFSAEIIVYDWIMDMLGLNLTGLEGTYSSELIPVAMNALNGALDLGREEQLGKKPSTEMLERVVQLGDGIVETIKGLEPGNSITLGLTLIREVADTQTTYRIVLRE